MHSTRIGFCGLAAAGVLLIGLAGCETRQTVAQQPAASQAQLDPAAAAMQRVGDVMETHLIAPTGPADAALASAAALESALDAYGQTFPAPPANLRAKINQIRQGSSPGMTGLGGIFGDAFLDAAMNALGQGANSDDFDPGKRVKVFLSGQITDYLVNDDMGGHIEATTYITRVMVPVGNGTPPVRTTAYRYRVEVANGGFSIVSRNDNASDGPFPGTLQFTDEMKARVELLGFNKKLWAKGEAIDVTSVEVARNYNPASPNWQTLPQGHPIYTPTDASCIDMMFNVPSGNDADVPRNMGELTAPPFYCLGRCDHPMLINTR